MSAGGGSRSWPYVLLVSVTVLVVLALVIAPMYVLVEGMQTTSTVNETYIDSSDYQGDPEAAVEDSTFALRQWMAGAIVLGLALTTLIAARQGRGRF
jgi:hypothetical protein